MHREIKRPWRLAVVVDELLRHRRSRRRESLKDGWVLYKHPAGSSFSPVIIHSVEISVDQQEVCEGGIKMVSFLYSLDHSWES